MESNIYSMDDMAVQGEIIIILRTLEAECKESSIAAVIIIYGA